MQLCQSIFLGLAISILFKPLYYIQLSTIAFLTQKKIDNKVWIYNKFEILTLILTFIFMSLLLHIGGIFLGFIAGLFGILHLIAAHRNFFQNLQSR